MSLSSFSLVVEEDAVDDCGDSTDFLFLESSVRLTGGRDIFKRSNGDTGQGQSSSPQKQGGGGGGSNDESSFLFLACCCNSGHSFCNGGGGGVGVDKDGFEGDRNARKIAMVMIKNTIKRI